MLNSNDYVIATGSQFTLDNKRCRVLNIVNGKVHLEFEDDHQELVGSEVIQDYLLSNRIKFDVVQPSEPLFFTTDKEVIENIRLTKKLLIALDNDKFSSSEATRIRILESVYEEEGTPEKSKIKQSKLRDQYKLWVKNDRDVLALFRKQKRRSRPKISDIMHSLINEVIQEEYLKRGGPSAAECLRIIEDIFKRRKLAGECIKKSQYYQGYIKPLDEYEVELARKGRDAARALAKRSGKVIHADYPGQVVEMDAVHLSVGIIDEVTHEYLGTLIVYVTIDRCTRYVLGYSMSIKGEKQGESTAAVLDMIKHTVQPKKPSPKTKNQWIGYITPELFVGDAGTAFNNQYVKVVIANIPTSIKTCEAGDPVKKPFIERFFLTLRNEFAIKLPGYRRKRRENVEYKGSIVKNACLYMSEAKELFEKYILDHYHPAKHKGLENESPELCWKRMMADCIPRPAANMEQLKVLTGSPLTRVIQAGQGIQQAKLYYNDANEGNLYQLYKDLKKDNNSPENPRVEIFYNDQDVSAITVVDRINNRFLRIHCTDKSILPGTTLHQLETKRNSIPLGEDKIAFGEDNSTINAAKLRQAQARREQAANRSGRNTAPLTAATEQSADDAAQTITNRNAEMTQNYSQQLTAQTNNSESLHDSDQLPVPDLSQCVVVEIEASTDSDWDDIVGMEKEE